ncbi:MAG: CAP domain-containing protein [Spirochaetales bacterium]|nr:CAP domain-containing protein [Spirochaetales bacterium]
MVNKIIFRSAISVLVLCSCITINYSGDDYSWTDADYEIYDFRSFPTQPAVNARIDMDNIDYPLLHAAIFYETNRQREKYGRQPFLHSPALERAAWGHSRDMVAYNFYSHTSPVKGKETMSKRLALVGIRNASSAENIAYTFGIEYEAGRSVYSPLQNGGYFSYELKGEPIKNHTYLGLAKEAVNMWMNSSGHRANILNPDYKYLGVGAAHYQDTGFFNMDNFKLTQNFASIKGE